MTKVESEPDVIEQFLTFLSANPDMAVSLTAMAAICFVVWCMKDRGVVK
jgi:hypothetical protein